MLVKAILLYLVSIIGNSTWLLGNSLISQPIVMGTLTGVVMGDVKAGIVMGATMELAFIGAVSIGAYDPPDMVVGTILGVAFAIQAGAGAEAALTLGLPVATIMQAVNTVKETPIFIYLAHRADRYAREGNYRGIERIAVLWPVLVYNCLPVVFLAFYFGSDVVVAALDFVPEFIQVGMEAACGIVPALGFAMLAQMIMKKNVAPFFFLGYFLIQYFGLTTTGVAVFAAIFAAIYILNVKQTVQTADMAEEAEGGGFDEF